MTINKSGSKVNIKLGVVGLLLLVSAALAGCNGQVATTAEAAQIPVVTSDTSTIAAEGTLEPERWSSLTFEMSGNVAEVLVAEGATVVAGDVLVRLGTSDLERALARAELALAQAELRLLQLQKPPDEVAIQQAENAVSQAAAAIRLAQSGVATTDNSVLRNEALQDAQRVYDDRRHAYETALRLYQSGEQPDYWFVNEAQEQLDDARLNLERVQQGGNFQLLADRTELLRAQLNYQEAQTRLAHLLEGSDAQTLAMAELDVRSAELTLEEARDSLNRAVLRAPFAGIVTKININAGEMIAPGQAVLTLATLAQLQVRTVDLTELNVAKVQIGQPVAVTVDALPGQQFNGMVSAIALESQNYLGDVVYTVIIQLSETDTRLRWGMTTMVKIQVD